MYLLLTALTHGHSSPDLHPGTWVLTSGYLQISLKWFVINCDVTVNTLQWKKIQQWKFDNENGNNENLTMKMATMKIWQWNFNNENGNNENLTMKILTMKTWQWKCNNENANNEKCQQWKSNNEVSTMKKLTMKMVVAYLSATRRLVDI